MQVKELIRKTIRRAGYQIQSVTPATDTDVYERMFAKPSLDERRFYNVGAGGFRHPYWTNIDNESEWYSAAQKNSSLLGWDLLSLKPLPLETGSAEIVYTSHVVEHVSNEADQNLFNEAYRVLKPGGIFRVTTPNIDLTYRAYKANDRAFFYWADEYVDREAYESIKLTKAWTEASIQQFFLFEFASSASTLHADGAAEQLGDDEVDRIFREMAYETALDHCLSKCSLEVQKKYPGNHINWWSADKAFRMLREAGFKNVYLSGYGQSASPVLRNTSFFDNTHPRISLYVEATK